jgi:hypothetical protein
VLDILAVFPDGPVGREFARTRYIEDGSAGPLFLVPVKFSGLILTINIRPIVRQHQILIPLQQGIHQVREKRAVAAGKDPATVLRGIFSLVVVIVFSFYGCMENDFMAIGFNPVCFKNYSSMNSSFKRKEHRNNQ